MGGGGGKEICEGSCAKVKGVAKINCFVVDVLGDAVGKLVTVVMQSRLVVWFLDSRF